MKKFILPCLLSVLTLTAVNAQVKKTGVKAKTPAPVAKAVLLTKVDPFAKTPDDLVQFLNDEFKKLDLSLKDIDESTAYKYDANGVKSNSVISNTKDLTFSGDVTASIIANAADQVTGVWIDIGALNIKRYKAIKGMLSFSSWPIVTQDERDTTFKNGNKLAYARTVDTYNDDGDIDGEGFTIAIERTTPYTYVPTEPKIFDPKMLTVRDNIDDLGYNAVNLLKGLGLTLLNKNEERPVVLDGRLFEYSVSYYLTKSVSVDIQATPHHKLKSITIDAEDPLTFLKIKKALGLAGWNKTDTDPDRKAEYYSHNNIECRVYGDLKSASFDIEPEPTDLQTRLENTATPTFTGLLDLYHDGKEKAINSLSELYINDLRVNEYAKPITVQHDPSLNKSYFIFRTDGANTMGRGWFNFELTSTNSVAVILSSQDVAFMRGLYNEYLSGKYKDKYFCLLKNGDNVVDANQVFNQILVMNRAMRDAQIAAIERQKEQARLDAIAKEKEKAAKSAESLNNLINALDKLNKRP